MRRIILVFGFAFLLLTGTVMALRTLPTPVIQAAEKTAVFSPPPGISILNANEKGLSFQLETGSLAYSESGLLTSAALNMSTQETGAPELPYFSTYLVVPPEATVSIDVVQQKTKRLPGLTIAAVAEPVLSFVNDDPDSPFPATAVSPEPNTRQPNLDIYSSNTLYPQQLYSLSEPVYFRDMRLVKLDLYPVQARPLAQEVVQTEQMQVNIHFNGAQLDNLQSAPSLNDAYQSSVADLILNFEQGKAWRSLPLAERGTERRETAVSLPLGAKTYKIEINQDGIYDITGADLAAQGMNIGSINPATIQMMSRGETVAYDFIKNGDNSLKLQSNDIIRFYGEGVNGSRREKQFLTHNVYWLWANGSPTAISKLDNAPIGSPVTSFNESITREDENYFFSTWTNRWNESPNEADSWYWDLKITPKNKSVTTTYTIDLPDPVLQSGQVASYTVEVLARHDYRTILDYQIKACLNSQTECTQKTWRNNHNIDVKNINITQTIPITTLIPNTNVFSLTLANPVNPALPVGVYLNRITVEYLRSLKAQNDQLFFTDTAGGRPMVVQDFGENDPNKILVWDISTPTQPVQIKSNTIDILEHNGRYTYTIGIPNTNAQNYIATTTANTLTPDSISQYTAPTTLEPTAGADWVAIAYGDFLPQANILAAHRQQTNYGGLKTHVINIKDIINVYGYGLPMPDAIHTYLTKSLTWSKIPGYVMLFGDGLIAPRHLNCLGNCTNWDINAQNLVPTDLSFTDPYQGLVPTDNTTVFLVGNDLLPDMAIGRLTAETTAQATAMVDKIIQYELNLYAQTTATKRVLFLSDFPDPSAGGSFCNTNRNVTGPLLPSEYEQIHLCIEDTTVSDPSKFNPITYTEAIQTETAAGIFLMNYRGHGAIESWGGPNFWWVARSVKISSDPEIFDYIEKSDQDLKIAWANEGSPPIILSADCLDGFFAWPGRTALSERYLRLDDKAGSVAHWSSAGLGLDSTHTILLEGFYQGLFDHDQINLGNTINYAKLHFKQSASYTPSEMYSFNLQGDPAMQVILPPPTFHVYLPAIKK